MKRVCVIVITFNGRHHLENLLPTLDHIDPAIDHILVVDNASTDGTTEFVHDHYPSVEVLRNRENFGFAKGNNEALKLAMVREFKYALLLNDDTSIVDTRWLEQGVRAAESGDDVGFVGYVEHPSPDQAVPWKFSYVPVNRIDGWGMLIKTDVLGDVGLFDEEYFAYGEESDLQARGQLAGYRILKLSTPIHHLGGGSFGKQPRNRVYLRARNWIRYAFKMEARRSVLPRIFQVCLYCIYPQNVGSPSMRSRTKMFDCGSPLVRIAVLFEALAWNLGHLRETLKARREDLARVAASSISRKNYKGSDVVATKDGALESR